MGILPKGPKGLCSKERPHVMTGEGSSSIKCGRVQRDARYN